MSVHVSVSESRGSLLTLHITLWGPTRSLYVTIPHARGLGVIWPGYTITSQDQWRINRVSIRNSQVQAEAIVARRQQNSACLNVITAGSRPTAEAIAAGQLSPGPGKLLIKRVARSRQTAEAIAAGLLSPGPGKLPVK